MKKRTLKYWHSLDTQLCKDSAFAAILLLIIGYFGTHHVMYLRLTAICAILAMVYPQIFKPFAFLWYGIAKILGLFVPKIVLTLIYCIFVIPAGLIRKAAGKDDMKLLLWKKSSASVFVDRNHTYTAEDLKQPF